MREMFYSTCHILLFCFMALNVQAHSIKNEDLAKFFDEQVLVQLQDTDIAGAVISVVRKDEIVFAKGYGYADKVKKLPISSTTTLFRPGSISKLFTWTAVMQQVEQGKLDIDRDINEYLDIKIPETFAMPITLRDLMTHRAGFEETVKDLFSSSIEEQQSLKDYLSLHLPNRIYSPGKVPAYSNYGAILAAYIVERVSGQKFEDYVENTIFRPLNMSQSTFHQPPTNIYGSLSEGYKLGSNDPYPFEIIQPPAGGLSTTAEDMGKFMRMHLQEGRVGEVEVLKSTTAKEMQARQEGWPSSMNAMCLGFYEQSQNGYRIIGHEGHTQFFHSKMFLILDESVGVFVSYNSAGLGVLDPCGVLFDKFMERFFLASIDEVPKVEQGHINEVVGTYTPSRRYETTFLAISNLFRQAKVWANPDQTLSMTGFNTLHGEPLRFREAKPFTFIEEGGKGKLAFVKNDNGDMTVFADYDTHYPSEVYLQVKDVLKKQSFNFLILGFCLSVIILTVIAWPIATLWQLRKPQNQELPQKEKRLRIAAYLACLYIVGFIIGLGVFISTLSDISQLATKNDIYIRMIQAVGLKSGLGAMVIIYYSLIAWQNKTGWFWSRVWNIMLALSCVGFFWFIWHWNMLNINLAY